MQTLGEIRTEIFRLRWRVAAARFQIALHRHALALKAGFNPDQPRDELGRWTDTGRDDVADEEEAAGASESYGDEFSDVRRRPPIKAPSDIPIVRPETIQEMNWIAREVSRNPYLSTYYFVTLAESVGHWLNEKYWEIRTNQDPPKTLKELQGGFRASIDEVMMFIILSSKQPQGRRDSRKL